MSLLNLNIHVKPKIVYMSKNFCFPLCMFAFEF